MRTEVEVTKIRVAAIQIPFLPAVVRPQASWLSEPEGSVNFVLIGQKKEEISLLQSFLERNNIDTEILAEFQSDYLNWLTSSVEAILDYLCTYEDPNIILFPEYSLPIDAFKQLQELLVKYSQNRCIVAGVGVSSPEKSERSPNNFVVIIDKKVRYGGKKIPSPDEEKVVRSGDGPFVYKFVLENDIEMCVMIAMCSDFISLGRAPDEFGKAISDELDADDDIGLVLVPAFTLKSDDIRRIGIVQSVRGYRIVALANCYFAGGTKIWFAPYKYEGLEKGSSPSLERGESGIAIADIPYPPTQLISPESKPIGRPDEIPKSYRFSSKKFHIRYGNENNHKNGAIEIPSEKFAALINNRLNMAIAYLSVLLMGLSPPEKNGNQNEKKIDEIIRTMNRWKKLQDKIDTVFESGHRTIYKDIPELIMPYFERIIFRGGPEQYTLILSILKDVVGNEYGDWLEKVKTYIANKPLPPFHLMISMSKKENKRRRK